MTRKGPTKKVDAHFARGRLENARAYLQAARDEAAFLDDGGNANPAMSQIVNAAIGFADAVTALKRSEVNQQDHGAVVKTLRAACGKTLPDALETKLRRIIEIKDAVQYGASRGKSADAQGRLKDLEEFAAWAELQFAG